jgi:hypothetical protein
MPGSGELLYRGWPQPLGDYDGEKTQQNDLGRRAPMAEAARVARPMSVRILSRARC